MKVSLAKKITAWTIVGVALVLMYAPIVVLIVYSFAKVQNGKIVSFSFSAYSDMFRDKKLMAAVLNTFILGLSSAALATVIGTFTAIGMFSMKRNGRRILSGGNQITVINADIVTGIAFFLLFVFLRNVGLPISDGWATLIIAHTMITVPYVILTMLPRLRQLNPNVYEAALDLGASPFYATVRVLLPQLFGAMIAGFALAFTLSLDDFVIARYNKGGVDTISTFIYGALRSKGLQNSYRAMSALIFAVILALLISVNLFKARRQKTAAKRKI
jgi:spermidine/putrescine transport system permease protein